ncbi:BnaAnng18050D [Brassica napus]|uniref:BnaAnng18050D protein n=1 Tax=Brassica napus TaxID=3708 RepID=A0A078J911_BRANA|nr:BnaAnng18050D [Brassica napus]
MRLLNHGDQILAVRYEALTCRVFLYIRTELIQTQKDPTQTTTAKRSSDDGDEIERRWRRDRATTAKRSSYDGDGEEIKRRRRRDRATTVTKSSDDDDEIECIPRSRRDRVMTVKSSKNHKLTTAILTTVTLTKTTRKEELFHFLMQRRVLTQGEDLWFTFSDQPMRFSLREFHLITGLRCEENQTITEPLFKIMKKPYIWMLGKIDKFTVRMLYEMFKEKTRSMPKLERLSLGTAIITEAVIMAENPSSKIPRDRLQRYMNYRSHKIAWGKTAYRILMRSVKSLSASSWTGDSYEVSGFALAINLWAMSSVNVLGKSLGKPCETSSSSDPLCLHWDSTRTPTTTEVLELENINNVEVSTVIGLAEEYKNLVGATHSDDAEFHSVVKLVQQGYKMRRSDWEKGFVGMFVATEDIGQQCKTKDEDAEHGEDLNHNEDEEEKTDEKENKDEEYQKVKEQRKDKNHSMSNSEKLDKLIQKVRDLDKRVVMIQNVLGVKFNDSSPNKEDCENGASSGDRRSAQDYENEEDTIDEEATQNILGEIETTQKITQDEDTEKLESKSCLKQTLRRLFQHSILQTLIQGYKINIFYKTLFHRLIQHLRLLSLISFNKKVIVERVLMRDVCEIHVFQPLMKIKKRLVQQDSQVNKDVEPPLQKKFKADTDNVPLRRIERGQIPSIYTQPPFTGARKKHPILHPFEPVDKTRKEKMREWKMSNKRKKLRINQEIVTAKWFSDIETPGKSFQKRILKQVLIVGVKFLEEIDKKTEKYWLGVVVNLEKRSITTFNCAAMKFTDASLVLYVNAYAMALPFMIRNFFKDVSMDTSKFSIKIVSEGFPKVLKIEDIGVYALKLIECHAMRIVDMTKLSEEKIAIIREKLAVDIFSELQ